jgi:plastocyanin
MSRAVRIGLVLFVIGALVALRSSGPAAAATITVNANDFWFCNSSFQNGVCTTTITVGDTVTWHNAATLTSHTSTECDGACGTPTPPSPLWNSGPIAPGGNFSRQFNQVGTFNYECTVHPIQMKGQIIVTAAVGGIAKLPAIAGTSQAQAAPDSKHAMRWAAIAGGLAAGLVALGSTALFARRRRANNW